jgi:hypothetical protein
MTLNTYVLKHTGFGDCTCNGITSQKNSLTISNNYEDDVDLIVVDGTNGACNVLNPEDKTVRYVKAIPRKNIVEIVDGEYRLDSWLMMGGNYVSTSDSRYREITGIAYPVPVHDRIEK